MIVDGNWDTATLQKSLGKNLAPFVPPYANRPQKGVVQYPGDGFSVMSYTKHPKEAVAFLKFLTTPAAAKIISNAGLIPDIKGYRRTTACRTRCSTLRRRTASRRTRCSTT